MKIKFFVWKPLLPLLAESGAFWFSLRLALLQLLLVFFFSHSFAYARASAGRKFLHLFLRCCHFSVEGCCLNRWACTTDGVKCLPVQSQCRLRNLQQELADLLLNCAAEVHSQDCSDGSECFLKMQRAKQSAHCWWKSEIHFLPRKLLSFCSACCLANSYELI